MVTPEVKAEIQRILANKDAGLMLQWKEVEKILIKNGLAYTQVLKPELFLVHPSNRGGTGINTFSMHAKGSTICGSGADLSQLQGSVAFELGTTNKQSQIAFTASLAKQSEGMMASPSGSERYLTVAKGHTTQFCKAIKYACKTNQSSLAGPNGCLGSHLLSKDASLKKMVEEGWEWTIILACVEDEFPSLPSLIENACNASNSTFEAQNEIQLMSAILTNLKNNPRSEVDYAAVALECCHAGPMKSYAMAIGKYVQQCGGHVFHVIVFMHMFVCCFKMHAQNIPFK